MVLLAHADPEHTRRLIDALAGLPVVLHCDAKTPAPVFEAMTVELPDRVVLAPRVDTRLASWSLVDAELRSLRLAVEVTEADHVLVMSGADFPLTDPRSWARVLAPAVGRSWVWNQPLPHAAWDVPFFRDGGLWRLRHRFLTRDDQIRWIASKPVFLPWRRAVHPDLQPRASMHWKLLARPDIVRLLELLDSRPDLVAFGRTTFTPEESFLASVMASPTLWGRDALTPCSFSPSIANWPGHSVTHPDWFTEDDLPRIAAYRDEIAREAAAAAQHDPEVAALPNGGAPLVARKFGSRNGPEFFQTLQKVLW